MGTSGPETGGKRKSFIWELFKKFHDPKEEAEITGPLVGDPEITAGVPEAAEEAEIQTAAEKPVPDTMPEIPEESEKVEEPEPAEAVELEIPGSAPEDADAPAPASVKVMLDAQRMQAQVMISPPQEGGQHVTLQQLKQALQSAGVTYGVSDAMLNVAVRLKRYNQPFTAAKGTAPKDGMDGRIEEHFAHETLAHPNERTDGSVDYKDLQLIRDIPKGTVIADIIPPTPMQPGTNLLGKPLRGREGKKAAIRPGRGTALSEDGSQLLADRSGNLVFKNGSFEIEETLRIDGSVDNAVGNIVFSGDVVVEGDVCEGYSVRSGRNVTVNGFVEGATIIAKGNVIIKKGMNGMGKGRIEADGDVNCRFFENSDVYSMGIIEADSILNSTVASEDKILLKGRRGAIMGGSCSARNLIDARSIGSDSRVVTEINLGASSKVLEKHKQLSEEVKNAARHLEEVEKDLRYLMRLATADQLSNERRGLFSQKKQEHAQAADVLEGLRSEMQQIEEIIDGAKAGRLSAMELYPPVNLTMSGLSQRIMTEERNVSYYISEGEIKRGTKV